MRQAKTTGSADGWEVEPLPEWDNAPLPDWETSTAAVWEPQPLPDWEPLPDEWETGTEVVP